MPTFYPVGTNKTLAFDLSPHGTPTDLGYGVTWNDMCTTDQITSGNSPTECLHLSAGTSPSRLEIASAEYSAGTLLPLYFGTFNGDTPAYTDTFVINTDSTFQELNGVAKQTRTVTASGAVTVAKTDHIVFINKTIGAATTANLPSSPRTGMSIIIKDLKGDAATNNITVSPASGNIDNVSTFVINSNYGSWEGVYNGTTWSTVQQGGAFNGTITAVGGALIQSSVGIGTTSPSATLDVNGAMMTECVTVSTLPTGKKGMRHCVTDATSCTFLGALTGSGATFCPVVYNGSAWVGG